LSTNEFDIPEEINIHKQIWGKNPDEVIYGKGEEAEEDEIGNLRSLKIFKTLKAVTFNYRWCNIIQLWCF
jgi:hypothetical protein